MNRQRSRLFPLPALILAVAAGCTMTTRTTVTTVSSSPPRPRTAPAQTYATYGAPVEVELAVPLARVVATVKSDASEPVVIAGTIDAVCQQRGCWMTLEHEGEPVRVRFTASESCAEGFFVPKNAAGRHAIVRGTVEVKEVPVGMARHYAADDGASEAELAAITSSRKEITIVAIGVAIEGKDSLEAPGQ